MSPELFVLLLTNALFIAPMVYAIAKRDWLVAILAPIIVLAFIAKIINPLPEFYLLNAIATLTVAMITVFIFVEHTGDRSKLVKIPAHMSRKSRTQTIITALAAVGIAILLVLVLQQSVDNGQQAERNNVDIKQNRMEIDKELNEPKNQEAK